MNYLIEISRCESSCWNGRNDERGRLPLSVRDGYVFSPNGAAPFQPRAERSAALGSIANGNPALKGRSMDGAARGNGSPLQGFGAYPTPTQGDALGWDGAAPLGLNRNFRCWSRGRRHLSVATAPAFAAIDARSFLWLSHLLNASRIW